MFGNNIVIKLHGKSHLLPLTQGMLDTSLQQTLDEFTKSARFLPRRDRSLGGATYQSKAFPEIGLTVGMVLQDGGVGISLQIEGLTYLIDAFYNPTRDTFEPMSVGSLSGDKQNISILGEHLEKLQQYVDTGKLSDHYGKSTARRELWYEYTITFPGPQAEGAATVFAKSAPHAMYLVRQMLDTYDGNWHVNAYDLKLESRNFIPKKKHSAVVAIDLGRRDVVATTAVAV